MLVRQESLNKVKILLKEINPSNLFDYMLILDANSEVADDIYQALTNLKKLGDDALKSILGTIFSAVRRAKSDRGKAAINIGKGLETLILKKNNTPENRFMLSLSPAEAYNIALILNALCAKKSNNEDDRQEKLNTTKNRTKLVKAAGYYDAVCSIILTLSYNNILTQNNFDIALQIPEYGSEIADRVKRRVSDALEFNGVFYSFRTSFCQDFFDESVQFYKEKFPQSKFPRVQTKALLEGHHSRLGQHSLFNKLKKNPLLDHQIHRTIQRFYAEVEQPKDFDKSLWPGRY